MIITRLIGGLGNQMFQYAVGRALAMRLNTSLKLDTSAFETYRLHEYCLEHLNIDAGHASPEDVARFTHPARLDRVLQRCLRYVPSLRREVREEKSYFQYDASVLLARGSTYLRGYWQNERYFKHIEAVLRRELAVKTAPDAKSAEVARRID